MNRIELTGALADGHLSIEGQWNLVLHATLHTGTIVISLRWRDAAAWEIGDRVHEWIYKEGCDVKVVGELMGGGETKKPFIFVESIAEYEEEE